MEGSASEESAQQQTKPKSVRARLFKLRPIGDDLRSRVEQYVNSVMVRDLDFVRVLYGRVSPVLNKDFDFFWESPWVEEHIRDTYKKRKVEEQQKSYAVRSFIRASAQEAGDASDIEGFIKRVDQVTRWEDQEEQNMRDLVKTVSRVVISYEKMAVRSLLAVLQSAQRSVVRTMHRPIANSHVTRIMGRYTDGVQRFAHTLRRNGFLSDLFAGLVAAELLLANATGGTQMVTIHMSKRLQAERDAATLQLLKALDDLDVSEIPSDKVGIPLFETSCNVCVSTKGVLVMSGGDVATHVLDIDPDDLMRLLKPDGSSLQMKELDLSHVRTIHVTAFEREEDLASQQQLEHARVQTRRSAAANTASAAGAATTTMMIPPLV